MTFLGGFKVRWSATDLVVLYVLSSKHSDFLLTKLLLFQGVSGSLRLCVHCAIARQLDFKLIHPILYHLDRLAHSGRGRKMLADACIRRSASGLQICRCTRPAVGRAAATDVQLTICVSIDVRTQIGCFYAADTSWLPFIFPLACTVCLLLFLFYRFWGKPYVGL